MCEAEIAPFTLESALTATELFANRATSTVAVRMADAIGTSLSVVSGPVFSAAATGTSVFRVLVGDEILLVTNVVGNTLTVVRGTEGTVAAIHEVGAVVSQILTAAALNTLTQKASNLSDLASAPSARTNLGLGNVDNTSDVNKPVSTAQAAADALAVAPFRPLYPYAAGATVLNPSGELVNALAAFTSGAAYNAANWSAPASATFALRQHALASGTVRWSYFTARKTEVVTVLRTMTASVAAAGTTLARLGLYEVDDSGNLILIAASANDLNMFAGTGIAYSKTTTATAYKKRGKRYALGVLWVGATAPQLGGGSASGAGPEFQRDPLPAALVAAQADLPTTVTAASLTANSLKFYGATAPW